MTDKLIATAKDNMLRISPLKLSLIANSIVNKKVSNAVNQLKFSNKRIASSVLKVLNSAVANAENNNQLDIDKLFIKLVDLPKSPSGLDISFLIFCASFGSRCFCNLDIS